MSYTKTTVATTRFRGPCVYNTIWPYGVIWSMYRFRGVSFPYHLAPVLKGLSAAGSLIGTIAYLLRSTCRRIRSPGNM